MGLWLGLKDPTATYNTEELFSTNITHNLTDMAEAAGIYYALWRPEEKGYKMAEDIIPLLEDGLKKLLENPEHYKQYDSPNGWGIYDHFVPFVKEVLEACKEYPKALLHVSR